jgi:O-antigen ligase/polysaccharide polymerase Wzy-like membrane protein
MSQATLPSRHAASGDRGSALWRPVLLVVLMMCGLASFRHREADDLWGSSGFDVQVKVQIGVWLVGGLLGLYFLWRGRASLQLLRRGPLFWYSCFVALALLSVLYSGAPAVSLFRAMQLAVTVILVISMREHVEHVYLFACVYIALNWGLVLLGAAGVQFGQLYGDIPATASLISEAGTPAWRFHSWFGHPSEISTVAAVTAVGLAVQTRGRQWRTWGPVLAWLVLTVVLTMSRTAIFGMVLGFGVAAIYRRALLLMVCWIGFAACLFCIPDEPGDTAVRYLMRGQTAEQFQSISGRDQIFTEAIERTEKSWLHGAGFASGRRNAYEFAEITHSHNMLLEALSCTGIAGALAVTMVIVSLFATAHALVRKGNALGLPDVTRRGWELAAMLMPICAYSAVDCTFAGHVRSSTLLYVAVMAYAQMPLLLRENEETRHATKEVYS